MKSILKRKIIQMEEQKLTKKTKLLPNLRHWIWSISAPTSFCQKWKSKPLDLYFTTVFFSLFPPCRTSEALGSNLTYLLYKTRSFKAFRIRNLRLNRLFNRDFYIFLISMCYGSHQTGRLIETFLGNLAQDVWYRP